MKPEDRQLLASVAEGYAGDNVLENWEGVAEEFYRDTGFLRPGKSYPLGCEPDPQERNAVWNTWVKARGIRIAAAIRALLVETDASGQLAPQEVTMRSKTGEALRELRMARGISMGELARFLGTDAVMVSALERGVPDEPDEERRVRWIQMARAQEGLHPHGTCRCHGEGTCAWCRCPCSGCSRPTASCECEG